jgi:hypothetical protein
MKSAKSSTSARYSGCNAWILSIRAGVSTGTDLLLRGIHPGGFSYHADGVAPSSRVLSPGRAVRPSSRVSEARRGWPGQARP